MHRDYSPQGVRFYYVYKALAHPELSGYVKPLTLKERLLHVTEARTTLGTKIPWLADGMDNAFKHAMGDMPNSQWLFDAEGKLIGRWTWSDAKALRAALAKIHGPVDPPTTVDMLELKRKPRPASPAVRGVLPRGAAPQGAKVLIVRGKESATPFYLKLRAEAAPELLEHGAGALKLGFHLDPLYRVHWNNLAPPLRYELTLPKGTVAEPLKAAAAKVKEEADLDPREFLVELTDVDVAKPLEVTVHYFVCHDVEGWCNAASQTFAVEWRPDPDAGRARPETGRTGGGRGGRTGMDFKRLDTDGDGKLTRQEFPGPRRLFDRLDANGDGVLSPKELAARRRGGR